MASDASDKHADRLLAMYVEEYKMLRAEIADRTKNEFTTIAISITLASGIVGLLTQVNEAWQIWLLLASPIIFFILGLIFAAQESALAVAAEYIHKELRPAAAHLLDGTPYKTKTLWAWETFRGDRLYKKPRLLRKIRGRLPSFLAIAVPGIAALWFACLLWIITPTYASLMHGGQIVLLVVDCLLYVYLAYEGLEVSRHLDNIRR